MSLLQPIEARPGTTPGSTTPGRPLVKICGVTRPADAALAVALGADLIGLNFHPPSPRSLDAAQAEEIAAAVRGRALVVGVFVHRTADEIAALERRVGLDLLQFHGDQGPDELAPWGRRAVKVVRVPREEPPTAAALDRELARYPDAWGFLFDVRHPHWGGSGESFGWSLLAPLDRRALAGRPVLVAGGITPANAARALADSGADGVDVASGVETEPGIKREDRMRRLFTEVRTFMEVRKDGQEKRQDRKHP